ncbi:energy-coupling factor transporter transmembrane component T [uncultured Ellagibacter sp.]|uniref:energy-coupling factor transporter transmembrane component T n=1 Tax=uncultured Ellagibacter sp. TaxID=2137580 RepID=UPI0026128BE5|nr:energy-coupling factor transporter transmembrane component T [uncultured Ellagibacter sp.]
MNFASYHPALNLLFFVAVVTFTACWTRPGLVAVSFLCALAFSVRLRGSRAVAFGCVLALCTLAFAALFALNVHFGVTPIARTPIGNSITVESLTCGVIMGLKVAAILAWLSCALCVFTADKVVFLLGRVFPKAAMMLAVVLRAVPVAGDRARKIAVAQSGIGKGPGQGNIPRRIANALRRASILISWSIERFIEMSDSMRSRGSALRGRTAYSLYRFDNRDRALAIVLVALITVCSAATALGQTQMLFSPVIVVPKASSAGVAVFAAFFALCLLPLALQTAGEAAFSRKVGSVSKGESRSPFESEAQEKGRTA